MRHFRPLLTLLVAAATAAGCAPAGMAPIAPAVAPAARALVLDAKQGAAQAIGRVDLGRRGGRMLLDTVTPFDRFAIDHLEISLWEVENYGQQGNENEISRDSTQVEDNQLDHTLTFIGLRANTDYRIRATAYGSPGSGNPISVAAESFVDIRMGSDNRPGVALVPVQLQDVPFRGRATSNGLDVRDGGYDTSGPAFITPGAEIWSEAVGTRSGITIPSLGPSSQDDDQGENVGWNEPHGIATYEGFAYVIEQGNGTVRRMSAAGGATTLAGSSLNVGTSIDDTGTAAGFNKPTAIAADGDGNLYVADSDLTDNYTAIRKITPAGVVTTIAGGATGINDGDGTAAQFQDILGIAWDRGERLYISDNVNRVIKMMSLAPPYTVTTVAGERGVSGGEDGEGTNGSGAKAHFFTAAGMAFDRDGNLLVCDVGTHTIRKITFSGGEVDRVTTIAGSNGQVGDGTFSDDGTGADARFNAPEHIVIDGLGNAFVTERYFPRIRKLTFEPDGSVAVTTFSGDGTTADYVDSKPWYGPNYARYNFPAGMAFDQAGRLLVADKYNHLIRVIGFEADEETY